MPYADLHTHSVYSDGTMTPAELLAAARAADVTLLAVADHEELRGSAALQALCQGSGVTCVPAVELSAFEDTYLHVLAYGADFDDPAFAARVRENRRLLDAQSERLLSRMKKDYPTLSLKEYLAMERNPRLGGWKFLEYLIVKGVTRTMYEGLPFYARYGVDYDSSGFPALGELVDCIHRAGGLAVLAHPGEVLPEEGFADMLKRLLDYGLDGIECYYPKHTPETERICLDLCRERGLCITAGSDCHGAFCGAPVGATRTPVENIRLRGWELSGA